MQKDVEQWQHNVNELNIQDAFGAQAWPKRFQIFFASPGRELLALAAKQYCNIKTNACILSKKKNTWLAMYDSL